MSTITSKDGTQIFYKYRGDKSALPIVISHRWPLTADDWDNQMLFCIQHGYRVIAHDRRGHGRSSQSFKGNDMDTYANDLAALMEHLNVHNAVHIGHSTAGGQVVRYLARHGVKRVAKGVLVGAVPPVMLKKVSNPGGTPMDVFEACVRASRATGRTSTGTWRCRSSVSTVPAPRCRKACAASGGSKACKAPSGPRTSASRCSRKWTSPRT